VEVSLEVFLALAGFSFVTSITPGPNNLMLLTSGVNFGFLRSIPHMLGIGIGFMFLLLCVGFGLGQVLTAYPPLHLALKVLCVAYLLYLAWKIANSGPIEEQEGKARPMTFLEAAAFQWVNPKAWFMAVTAMSVYTNQQNYFPTVIFIAIVFGLINIPTVSVWAGLGSALRGLLSNPKVLRAFNVTMALLLVASLWPMLFTGH
jgi:threonine/homoserine/homoserine lactone efflux protein